MTSLKFAKICVIAAGAALLVAACSPTTNVSTTSTSDHAVSVAATGMADVVPDAAKASLSVVGTDPKSAKAAQEAAAAATSKVIAALTDAGVAEADIATAGINVGPTYEYPSGGVQTLTGYQASQTLTVTLRDLATAGSTLDSVVAASGNLVRVDSVSTYVTDPTVAANKARAQAVDIAQKQAQQYAELLGFTLGPVSSVSESTSSNGPPPIAAAAEADSAGKVATPIQPGTTQVSVTVEISWLIND